MGLSGVISRARLVSLPVLGFVVGALLIFIVGSAVALLLAPAVVLALLLLHGIAPGEALIDRWRRQRSAVAHLRGRSCVPQRELTVVVRRVGYLLAAALAMRPPPAAAAVLSHR